MRLHACILGALLAVAPAQQQPQQPAASLHSAWMREVLDLDPSGAAADYARIAADKQAPLLERQIAIARECELRQHLPQLAAATPPDLGLVPEVLRQTFVQAQTPQPLFDKEQLAGRGDQTAVREFFAAIEVPQLRPLVVAMAHAAAEAADPSAAERLRQMRSRFLPWSNDPALVLDRIRANEIVRAWLDQQQDRAAELQRRAFPNWRPQSWPGDAAATWQRVAANLTEWLRERQLTDAERELLMRLQRELRHLAESSPESALHAIDHMPLFAERLRVGITGSTGR